VRGGEEGQRAGGRNDPNNICTYKYMNKENKVCSLALFKEN
jgi:hypothetical protein